MENKKIILKSNEAYALITSAIAQNRVGEKLLTPSEVEELIYYYLEQEYKEKLYSIRMTKDNENQQQIIIDQLRYGDIRVRLNNGNDLNIEIKSEKPYQELYKLRIDLWKISDCLSAGSAEEYASVIVRFISHLT